MNSCVKFENISFSLAFSGYESVMQNFQMLMVSADISKIGLCSVRMNKLLCKCTNLCYSSNMLLVLQK